jgi:hypothetical protein
MLPSSTVHEDTQALLLHAPAHAFIEEDGQQARSCSCSRITNTRTMGEWFTPCLDQNTTNSGTAHNSGNPGNYTPPHHPKKFLEFKGKMSTSHVKDAELTEVWFHFHKLSCV